MFSWSDLEDEDRRVQDWLGSGIVFLTGSPGHPPRIPPGIAATLASRLGTFIGAEADGAQFLSERAAFTGRTRQGAVSVGGTCRLLPTFDGWAAVSCAREDDIALLGALISHDVGADIWPAVGRWLSERPGAELAERATLLGLAAAPVSQNLGPVPMPAIRRSVEGMMVVDFSSLWAGPLCSHFLSEAGARVIKVETPARPDGARCGNPDFYSVLHAGHESVVLDPGTRSGRLALAKLVARADIVIEASRPRALAGFGLDAFAAVDAGTVWVSITAAGRDSARVGFGDDVAASSGLIAYDSSGLPAFVGDAIADPMTGLFAAALAMSETPTGGGYLWDISMSALISSTLTGESDTPSIAEAGAIATPRRRAPRGTAPRSGADTESVLRHLGIALP